MRHKFRILYTLAMAGGLALSAPAANATVYNFSQIAFYDALTSYTGGVIQGSFEATDGDSDGWITTPEITAFSLSFSGDSIIPGFTHGLNELNLLNYKIGTAFIGDDVASPSLSEGIDTSSLGATGFSYRSGLGAIGGWGGMVQNIETFENVVSDELVKVPAPTVLWLLGSALPGFIGFSRRKKAALA